MVKLKKRPDAIVAMMSQVVARLPEAAQSFHEIVSSPPDARPALAAQLAKIEEESDQVYLKLLRKVADTFITPYDREDIYRMIETCDDAIDSLDHAGRLVVDFEFLELPEELVSNSKELVAMSELARDAVGFIKKPNKMEKALLAINAHENVLDTGYRTMLRSSLTPGSDPIHAMKLKILADEVEKVSSYVEEFVRNLSVTAIKET